MKTKTLSLILAIAMLLCGCQTAPVQSVSAVPAPEVSELSPAAAEEKLPIKDAASVEKNPPVQHPQETEVPTEPVVAENGLKTYPAKYVKAEHERKFDKVENITPYMLDDQIVVIPDDSDVGYVLGKYIDDIKVFKEENMFFYYSEDGMFFCNLETLEKLDFALEVQCEDVKKLEEVKVHYDPVLNQYVLIQFVIGYTEQQSNGEIKRFQGRNVEIQRFDSDGKFIDKYFIETNADTYGSVETEKCSYNNGVIYCYFEIYTGRGTDERFIFCDFNTGETDKFKVEKAWGSGEAFIASRIDVLDNNENKTKTVTLTSAWIENDFNRVVKFDTVLDTDIDSELLDFGYSSVLKYFDDNANKAEGLKKQTIYTPWLRIEVDYDTGECTAELSSSHTAKQLEDAYAYVASDDGRFGVYDGFTTDPWYVKEYALAYDKVEKRAFPIGWIYYDTVYSGMRIINRELFIKRNGIIAINLLDGSIRCVVSKEAAQQHAKEKLGYLGGEIGAFAYDEKLDLLVLTMYDEPSEYSDYAFRHLRIDEEPDFNALKASAPNYFLAVYDMDGNFIKHVLTDSVVQATGKHGSLDIEAIPVDNGIAWPDSELAVPYMEEQPKYVVNGNKAYWRPVEKTSRNILCWRDFETETTGEMLIPNEWGELAYVFDDGMIFRNIETGICYKRAVWLTGLSAKMLWV